MGLGCGNNEKAVLILQRHLIMKTRFITPKYKALHRTPYGGNPKFSAVLGTPSGGHLTVETISKSENPNFQNKNAYGCQKIVLNFGNFDFEFVSETTSGPGYRPRHRGVGFRYSDLEFNMINITFLCNKALSATNKSK